MSMNSVRVLVLPVAGFGRRLHPLTLHTPKALVEVAGRPLLDYMLEEARRSGIREAALVIHPSQKARFVAYVKRRQKMFPELKFRVRFQHHPLGDGHAILQARDVVKTQPFAVRFSDDVVIGNLPVLASLITHASRRRASMVLLERVPQKLVSRYGVVGVREASGGTYRITRIMEKPARKDAPSNLTIVGGYVLMPSVMKNLARIAESLPPVGNDILRLALVLQVELMLGNKIYGWELEGIRLDCGSLEGIARAEAYIEHVRKPHIRQARRYVRLQTAHRFSP